MNLSPLNLINIYILFSCVISTMCALNLEFQLVNPTTQVALFSICTESYSFIRNIVWNIYYGEINSSSNYTLWTKFNQTDLYENSWFFGLQTSNFTATDDLFSAKPELTLWRFEVVYTFESEISSSSLNFIINQPPINGSCSISPKNGTTSTSFSISCPDWFDEDGIKDYSLYCMLIIQIDLNRISFLFLLLVWTTDRSERIIIAFSSVSVFQVLLPPGDDQTSEVHLLVNIRDQLDCITEYNMSSVTVVSDSAAIDDLIHHIGSSSNNLASNSIVRLLVSKNQNTVGQLLTSLSQYLNKMNNENLDTAVSSNILIFISNEKNNLFILQMEYQLQLFLSQHWEVKD